RELFESGLNVGKDIIGPMTNTLIFAYLASGFPLLLLSFDIPFIKFINFQSTITEILAALIGSIAIIYCVPITAAICAYLTCKLTDSKNSQNNNLN
ncbi:MAG: YibE/F family protein, partial [bacterium]